MHRLAEHVEALLRAAADLPADDRSEVCLDHMPAGRTAPFQPVIAGLLEVFQAEHAAVHHFFGPDRQSGVAHELDDRAARLLHTGADQLVIIRDKTEEFPVVHRS